MSYKLEKPYTEKERLDFIVLHNHQNGRVLEETDTALYALEAWEKLEGDTVIDNSEEYQQEQAKKEAARIALLNLTAADVERGLYKAKGIDFEDVLTQIEAMPLAEGQEPLVDIKALKIELKANNFYRGNPYINTIGQLLGLSTSQLDSFFEAGNSEDTEIKANAYKYLTTVTLTINPTPADSTVTINGIEQNTVTVPYGDTVEYSVAHEGYLTQSGTVELTEDTTLEVELEVNEGEEQETPVDTEIVEVLD